MQPDVIDLLDDLHIEEAVIGGLSMGGYIAFAIFRHAPRYFRGMILADTRASADTPEAVEGRKRMLQVVREKGADAVAEDLLPQTPVRVDAPRPCGGRIQSQEFDCLEFNRDDWRRHHGADVTAGFDTAPVAHPLPNLDRGGDQDALTPPSFSQEMQRGIGGAEIGCRAGCRAHVQYGAAAAFNLALARFLEYRV